MKTRLTQRKLRAIIEALIARTAGDIDVTDDPEAPRPVDYEDALQWALSRQSSSQLRNDPP
jgi:hypothetical protein